MADDGQKKILFIKIGVGALAAFLLLLWLVNLKNVWRLNNEAASDSGAGTTWLALKNDIDRTMAAARGQLNQAAGQKEQEKRAGQNFLLDLLTAAQRSAVTATNSPVATSAATIPATTPPATTSPVIKNK
jgi:hypothetical protein